MKIRRFFLRGEFGATTELDQVKDTFHVEWENGTAVEFALTVDEKISAYIYCNHNETECEVQHQMKLQAQDKMTLLLFPANLEVTK